MYKVLIVDDEKMIRMGIKMVIPWEELGIHDIYTAATGIEALEIIREQKPEIMITDIQMTGMSGLELIEEAMQIMPEIQVIILTGYDNFEYARKSLRLNVKDFFLKPIDEEELKEAVIRQVDFLNKKAEEEKNQAAVYRTQGMAKQAKLEQAIRSVIHNSEDKDEQIRTLIQEFGYQEEQKMEVVLMMPILCINQRETEQQFNQLSIKNICMSMIDAQGKGITFDDENGFLGIIFFENNEEEVVLEVVEDLSDIIKDEFDLKPKMAVGSTVSCMRCLHISYNDAKYLLETEKESIRDISQTFSARNKVEIFQDILIELKNIMCSNVSDSACVLKGFDTFGKAVKSYNLSAACVRWNCFEIASALFFSYLENAGDVESKKLEALAKSLVSANREEACEVTRMFIVQMLERDEENNHHIIAQAKRYIDENITEELSVSSIAANLYVTPNYFSRLFKRVTKEGCNEYIVRKRIEKAKSLLETTSIKTGKIAMMVGYRDTNYFSLAFKKHTGKSPTKYREEMQNNALNG